MDEKFCKNSDNFIKKPDSLIFISMMNFVLGGICLIPAFLMFLVVIYGIFFSGDPVGEKFLGIIGSYFISLPGLLAATLFISSGAGVFNLKRWGFYVQIATAIMSLLSIIGIPYGIFVLLTMFKPEIKQLFSGNKSEKALPYIE
jgi:hypothetical protein